MTFDFPPKEGKRGKEVSLASEWSCLPIGLSVTVEKSPQRFLMTEKCNCGKEEKRIPYHERNKIEAEEMRGVSRTKERPRDSASEDFGRVWREFDAGSEPWYHTVRKLLVDFKQVKYRLLDGQKTTRRKPDFHSGKQGVLCGEITVKRRSE